MNEIKQYKPLALVFYIDGNGNRDALPLDDSKREQFKQIIENQKMVELEGTIINTFDIKEIKPASKVSDIEKYFYSREYSDRAYITEKVRQRVNNMKANVIEALSEFWTIRAIGIMEQWVEWRHKIPEPIQEEEYKPSKISEEDKEYLKEKFRSILSHYTS